MFSAMGYSEPAEIESLEPITRQYFEEGLKQGTFHGWLGVDPDGNVVAGGGIAFVSLPPGPFAPTLSRPEIINLYVEPGHRHRGIARQLMEVMIGWCRERGFVSVYLHASDEGRPLYASMGFEPTPEMRLRIK
jgi:GNAT superfamily N-acetyltransferase